MRIDPNLSIVPITKDTSSKAKPTAPGSGSGSTVVTLSAGATASASAQAQPTDISSRLDRIRALLAKGDYPVDLDKLASRIVDDDHARSGTTS